MASLTPSHLKGYFYDGTYIFKGVPYAYADRFQMPVPFKWEGVKDATSYGFVCPLMTQDTPSAELLVPHRYWPMDEHCQNLISGRRLWTKAQRSLSLCGSMAADILPVPPLNRWLTMGAICVWRGTRW